MVVFVLALFILIILDYRAWMKDAPPQFFFFFFFLADSDVFLWIKGTSFIFKKKKSSKKFFFFFNLNDMLRVFIRKSYVRVQICLFFRVSFMILLAILVVLNV